MDPFPDLVLPQPSHNMSYPPSSISGSFTPELVFVPAPIPFESVVRRSTKVTWPHSYLQNYHCHLITQIPTPHTPSSYPLENFISYSALSSSHRQYILNISSNFEPQFYHKAVPYAH